MLKASAVNVVAMIAMPAMPGTITLRFSWSLAKTAPNSARRISGKQEVEEGRGRVAPEHAALEPVLAPDQGQGGAHEPVTSRS